MPHPANQRTGRGLRTRGAEVVRQDAAVVIAHGRREGCTE
jgi:hypothetical protein